MTDSASALSAVEVRGKHRRRRRAHIGRWVAVGLGAVLLLALTWLLITGLLARTELLHARQLAQALKAEISSGEYSRAANTAKQLRSAADDAHEHTSGPAWSAAAAIPVVGAPAKSVRAIATSADIIGSAALPTLVTALQATDRQRGSQQALDLAPVLPMLPALSHAYTAVDSGIARVQNAPATTWLSSVDSARTEVLSTLEPVDGALGEVSAHTAAIRTLLGGNEPQSILLAFENDAEIRPTGGIAGSFAVLTAKAGRISFGNFKSDAGLSLRSSLHLGSEYKTLYQNSDEYIQDVNASPNFPTDARIYSQIWQQVTGQRLAGVIALDPTTLSYLLSAIGPTAPVNGLHVSASNVIALTQANLYQEYPRLDQNRQRRNVLISIAEAVAKKLSATHNNIRGVTDALSRAAREHRLLFWDRSPIVERWLTTGPIGGSLPPKSKPSFTITLNNDSQSKLDYYLHATVNLHSVCHAGMQQSAATITVRNEAPSHLPSYVEPAAAPRGTEKLYVGAYIGGESSFTSVRDNGKIPFRLTGTDQGHPAFLVYATVPRGKESIIVFHWTERVVGAHPIIRLQPMINPMRLHSSVSLCHN